MALAGKPVILQVTGYQNSGKTELVKKLIQHAAKKGYRTATIKHHGHGGKPHIKEEKDSSKHVSSGAIAAIAQGEGRLLLQAEKNSWTVDEQIELLGPLRPDLILIEGHKKENYPKIVILRDQNDLHLLKDLPNIAAVLYWNHPLRGNSLPFTEEELTELKRSFTSLVFYSIHEESFYEWFCQYLYKFLDE